MKKLFFVVFLIISIPAYAIDYFFNEGVGHWSVLGHPGDKSTNLNPACIARTTWQDGSYLLLIQDLADGELFIEFKNNEWNISDPINKKYEMTLNIYNNDKSSVESWDATFDLLNKNTITIRGLDFKKFLPAFMNYSLMTFIMPGTIANANVDLKNTSNAVGLMTQCLKSAEKGIPQNSNNRINS